MWMWSVIGGHLVIAGKLSADQKARLINKIVKFCIKQLLIFFDTKRIIYIQEVGLEECLKKL